MKRYRDVHLSTDNQVVETLSFDDTMEEVVTDEVVEDVTEEIIEEVTEEVLETVDAE